MRVVPWAPQHGVVVLGTPINYPSSTTFADAFWEKITGNLEATVQKVTDLVDTQCAHHLLRKCLDGCKVNHLLRSTDTYTNDGLISRCEEAIITGFEDLLRCGLTPLQRAQVGLPM